MSDSRAKIVGKVLILLALPAWIFLLGLIFTGMYFGSLPERFLLATLILGGTTAALHRLLRRYQNAWPMSALIAGYVLIMALFACAAFARGR